MVRRHEGRCYFGRKRRPIVTIAKIAGLLREQAKRRERQRIRRRKSKFPKTGKRR